MEVSGELSIRNLLNQVTKYNMTFKLVHEYSKKQVSDVI